jgi:hypothetical protein
MSPIESAFLVAGAVATVLFFAGFARGALTAIGTHNATEIEVDDRGDVQAYWWQIAFAVAAAAVTIGLAGVLPAFIYLGPALAIVTAAANGLAFFLERKPGAA